jgi:hypothetical protein
LGRAARAEAILERWLQGEPADALAALAADPDLASDRSLAIDLAYEEFCIHRAAGSRPVPHEFARRFPFRTSLLRLIAVHSLFDRCPDLFPPTRPVVKFHSGEVHGDYRIVRPLGQGGFSDVYLARDLSTGGRGVVLKASTRTEFEANKLGRLSHPYLMPVWSVPLVESTRVMVMPFYGVATLDDVLEAITDDPTKPLTATEILKTASRPRQPSDPEFTPTSSDLFTLDPECSYDTVIVHVAWAVASALAYLHEQGMTHADIKPANVLLSPNGHPYLLDLNLAAESSDTSRPGGTMPYLAPETLATSLGERPASVDRTPADIYAFGVMLWELLTGSHPYLKWEDVNPNEDPKQAMRRVADCQRQNANWQQNRVPQVSEVVWQAVQQCLAFAPEDRPRAVDLVRVFSPPPPARRRKFPTVALVLTGALLAVGVAVTWWLSSLVMPQSTYEQGLALVQNGEWELAASKFHKAAQETNDGRNYAWAAYCFARVGSFSPSIRCVEQAYENGYQQADLYANRAYCQMHAGSRDHYEKAMEDCLRAISLDPECRAAYLIRLTIQVRNYQKNGRALDRTAREDAEQVIRLAGPESAQLWFLVAHGYGCQPNVDPKDHDQAVAALIRAIQLGYPKQNIVRLQSLPESIRSHPAVLALPDYPGQALDNSEGYLTCPPGR